MISIYEIQTGKVVAQYEGLEVHQAMTDKAHAENWTPERRLEIIQALAAQSLCGPKCETHAQLMQRIMFLCDMPDEFLEINKGNYEDAIKLADAGFVVSL